MTVLDAYAVIAYLRNEPAAAEVAALLDSGSGALTSTGLAEVVDHLVRVVGADEDDAVVDLGELGLLATIETTAEMGLDAGRLRARHYHRSRRAVSLADCAAAASARATGRPLATPDPHLLDLCQDEGIKVVVLPQSNGSVWKP